MSLKKTNEQFIKELKTIFGDMYDYTKVEYENNIEKICLICHKHGEFYKSPKKLLIGQGCPICSKEQLKERTLLTTKDFIQRAIQEHGNKYDYSKVHYKGINNKICVVCPIHGEFWQTPNNHLNGHGCPKCSGRYQYGKEEFVERARIIHGNKYDYSNTEYINSQTKIYINCPEHGEFSQKPNEHLKGKGCPKCSFKKVQERKTIPSDEFVKRAKETHDGKYGYEEKGYNGIQYDTLIHCPLHGDFYQKGYVHLQGFGCSKCSRKHKYTTKEFIDKSKEIHNDRYDYSKAEYINSHTKVCIICPIHGEFYQMPYLHLKGEGCHSCSHLSSNAENEVANFIYGLGFNVIRNNKEILDGKEIDIYIPERKAAIEYDGLIWHSGKFGKSKDYHLMKTQLCEEKGIRLIHIFEDEWLNRRKAVEFRLKRILNCINLFNNVNIDKCNIVEIGKNKVKDFLKKNNIEEYKQSFVNIGCIYGVKLIGLMSFARKTQEDNSWFVSNCSLSNTYESNGLIKKIITYFIEKHNPNSIRWDVDRRWFNKTYESDLVKIGFVLKEIGKPRYYYVVKHKRLTKYDIIKMKSKSKEYKRLTESEFVNKMNYYRIYDCGTLNYLYKI